MICYEYIQIYIFFVFIFAQVADRAEHIGSALLHRGHAHATDKFIGIFSVNRPEVQQTHFRQDQVQQATVFEKGNIIQKFIIKYPICFPSQWTISELGCYTYSLVAVPLYDTLGREAISYIINKGTTQTSSAAPSYIGNTRGQLNAVCSVPATISTVICDVPEKALMVLDCVNGKGTSVKMIVIMETFETNLVERAQELDIEIISFKEFEVWITFF